MSIKCTDNWHYVIIHVTTKFGHGDTVEFIKWDKLPWHVRNKWGWYFKYRAALAQVEYPKFHVDFTWGNYDKYTEEEKAEKELKDKIAGKRRMITKLNNAIIESQEEWNELFPIEEYPVYKKVLAKKKRYESELEELKK
jgi:hypothetical protein